MRTTKAILYWQVILTLTAARPTTDLTSPVPLLGQIDQTHEIASESPAAGRARPNIYETWADVFRSVLGPSLNSDITYVLLLSHMQNGRQSILYGQLSGKELSSDISPPPQARSARHRMLHRRLLRQSVDVDKLPYVASASASLTMITPLHQAYEHLRGTSPATGAIVTLTDAELLEYTQAPAQVSLLFVGSAGKSFDYYDSIIQVAQQKEYRTYGDIEQTFRVVAQIQQALAMELARNWPPSLTARATTW